MGNEKEIAHLVEIVDDMSKKLDDVHSFIHGDDKGTMIGLKVDVDRLNQSAISRKRLGYALVTWLAAVSAALIQVIFS